jgi:GST-like protein
MKFPEDFPITKRWPSKHPDRLQLYSLTTTNGVKASIMLEEIGLPYEAHYVDFGKKDQKSPEFMSLNPNGRIPAIIDPNGPDEKPLALFESGAILHYLAEKTGKLLPTDPARKWEALQWLHFQMSAIGPMFGQVGWFYRFDGKDIADKRPLQRYIDESKRLFEIVDARLDGRTWMMGDDYTIVDIAIVGPFWNFLTFYKAGDLVGFDNFKNAKSWYERMMARPAVQRGLTIPAKPTAK